uniref:Uncharacterized protein n=1 Tax=Octopus bimaculoides TaxID=37653 RepID=A0A0L8GQ52_OCTBM
MKMMIMMMVIACWSLLTRPWPVLVLAGATPLQFDKGSYLIMPPIRSNVSKPEVTLVIVSEVGINYTAYTTLGK